MPADDFDVLILGGGMGGYPAAIRASQLGLKVGLVEADKLGGTCLHVGCIPTKALLESSELYHRIAVRGPEFGVEFIISSDHATLSAKVPESICIIGAGAVGVEFATLYNQLGVKVTLLEGLDRLVPLEDEEISKEMLSAFKKAGIECRVGVRVKGAKKARDGVSVDTEQGEIWARQLLVAVGRAPRSKEIGLEQVGVTTHPNGFIKADEWMRTTVESIHAIGDVVGGYLLAHAASHEGITAAEDIAGQQLAPMDQDLVTRCTYSHPQIASVGLTEKQARDKGIEVKVGKFPFTALGRAIINGETGGFAKMVADAKT